MSIGFRIFILIVLAFAALWVYRFREPELQRLFFGFQTQAQDRVPAPGRDAHAILTRRWEIFPPVDTSSMGSRDWGPDGDVWTPHDPHAELTLEEFPPQEWIPGAEYDAADGVDLLDPDVLPEDPTKLSEKDLKSDSQENDIDVKPISQSGERVSPRTHTVADKETLSRIARKYLPGNSRGVTLLFEANKNRLGLSSPNEIFAGQVLVIPRVDGTAKTD